MQRVEFLAGFVLHARSLRETSLLVDVFTPDHGVTRLVARGARSAKSKIRPLAQPFRPLLVSWSGRNELKTLTGLEEQGRGYALSGLELACAYYLNELLLRLLPMEAPCATVFAQYAQALSTLDELDDDAQQLECTLRLFELELLDSLGLVPDFSNCGRTIRKPDPDPDPESDADAPDIATVQEPSGGGAGGSGDDSSVIENDILYRYFPEQGYAIKVATIEAAEAAIKANSKMASTSATSAQSNNLNLNMDPRNATPSVDVHGQTLLSLAKREFDSQRCFREAKLLMRQQLGLHIGRKPLKSREMIAFYQ